MPEFEEFKFRKVAVFVLNLEYEEKADSDQKAEDSRLFEERGICELLPLKCLELVCVIHNTHEEFPSLF